MGSSPLRRDDQPVLSARLLPPLLEYFEEQYGPEGVDEALEQAGLSREGVADPQQWVSSSAVRRLNHALTERSGNPSLTYEAGLALLTPRHLGSMFYVLRALGSPSMVYRQIPSLNRPLSRINEWETCEVGRDRAVMRFRVAEGHSDDILFCNNRRGALVGIPRGFGLPPARVEHPHCIHQGDPYCEYQVSWTPQDTHLRLTLGFLAVLVSFGAVGVAMDWLPAWSLQAIPLFLALAAIRAAWSFRRQFQESASNASSYLTSSQRDRDADYRRYRDLVTVNRIDHLTRVHTDAQRLLDTALEELSRSLGYDRAAFLWLCDGRRPPPPLCVQAVGYTASQIHFMETWLVSARETATRPLLPELTANEEGTGVTDPAAFRAHSSPPTRELLEGLQPEAFVAIPVSGHGEELLGLLVVERGGRDALSSRHDRSLLGQLGHHLGLALENARHVEHLQRILQLNQKLSLYLDERVVAAIRDDPRRALELGGDTLQATVLFSDIKGFTQWASRKDPQTVVARLNRYFTSMDEIIAQTRGILDKRMGDGLMVVFLHPEGRTTEVFRTDDPTARPRHPAYRALQCALRMQRTVSELAGREDEHGFPPLQIRIGVAHGRLVSGNIGSERRFEHTVIGDVVNVASRLESDCPPGQVLTTRDTVARIPEAPFVYERFAEKELKGRKGRVELLVVKPEPGESPLA